MGIRISKQIAWFLPKSQIDLEYILETINEENLKIKEFLSFLDYIEESHNGQCRNKLIYIKSREIPPFSTQYIISKSGKELPEDLIYLARTAGYSYSHETESSEDFLTLEKLGVNFSKNFKDQVHAKAPGFLLFLAQALKVKKDKAILMKPVIAKQWR